MDLLTTFAAPDNKEGGLVVWLAAAAILIILSVIACWRVYSKSRKPGWTSIIPIYNLYILLKIVGRPGWWIFLYFIPIVNAVIHIIVSIDLAKAFGKSTTFGVVCLWLLSIIGYMILGFGEAKYKGVPKR